MLVEPSLSVVCGCFFINEVDLNSLYFPINVIYNNSPWTNIVYISPKS